MPLLTLLKKISTYQKIIFLLLAILAAAMIFWPAKNFQAPLSQGDHGRDLYAFWQTSQGATPYQNYWWCYGPLMPYYYGFLFKLFGSFIQTALLGEFLLNLLTVVFCYLALSCFVQTAWALLGAVWFAAFLSHFPHTYNHAGGITALAGTILSLFLYLRTDQKKFLWIGFVSVALTFLIKLNIGIYSLAGFLLCAVFSDAVRHKIKQNLSVYLYGTIALVVFLFAIHFWLVRHLPMYYILQCFPLAGNYRQLTPQTSLWANLFSFAKETFGQAISSKSSLATLIIVADFLLFGVLLAIRDRQARTESQKIFLAIGAAAVFFVFCLHEHLASPMIYSKYWAELFQALFIFLVLGFMAPKTPKILQVALIIFFAGTLAYRVNLQNNFIKFFKNPSHHFQMNGNDVYVTNAPSWFATVHQTCYALQKILKPNETFFALPYEPLYYFLTQKQSPTKELCFFDFMQIPVEQEKEVILNLEKKRISYVVLSNRCDSPSEPGTGVLGRTYGILLSNYLAKNFEAVATFGNWGYPVGWIDNHATKILKRKSFLIP